MKRILIFVFIVVSFIINAQETKYISLEEVGVFPTNEIVYTFGDNVKLRSTPSVDSEVYLEIPIAEQLTILEKNENKLLYNGIEWNWYKVKYKDKVGYVLGGLLSQGTLKINDDIYLNSFKKTDDSFCFLTRLVNKNNYLEHSNILGTSDDFHIKVFDNRGVQGIKNMICIDYIANYCGANGGGYYLFNDGETLTKAIELIQVSDGGYYEGAELVFPNDEEGDKTGLLEYIYENGGYLNEEEDDYFSIKYSKKIKWEGKEIKIELPKKVNECGSYY